MANIRKTYCIAGISAPAFLFLFFFIINIAACLLTIKYSYYTPLIIIGTFFFFYSLSNILLGICVVIFFHAIIIIQTPEISTPEIIFSIYFLFLFIVWFYKRIIIEKERILKEKADYFLLLFLTLTFLSFFPALINGVNMIYWFRELIPFLTFILFFLISTEVKNEKHTLYIILSIFAVAISFTINNILTYTKLLTELKYFWEITSSRQVIGEIFFTSSLILGFCFLISSIPKGLKLIIVPFVIMMGLSLALTFSRGYWITFIFAALILFIIANRKEKSSLLIYGIIFTGVLFIFATLYSGGLSRAIGLSLLERFPTPKDIFTDISFLNRISEAKGILNSIKYYFLTGAGLGARFDYLDVIIYKNINTWYSHNAFLYLLYKLGLPGIISFLCFYLIIIKYGFSFIKISSYGIEHIITEGITALLIAMFFLSVSSPQFFQKDPVLIIAVLSGLVKNFHGRKKEINDRR